MDTKLFSIKENSQPYKVRLPHICLPIQHYKVRCFLLDLNWEEFTDWIICPYAHTINGEYEVWFTDIGKATYFKLSFTL